MEDAVREAGKSHGKSDTEKMQQGRAQLKLQRMLGIAPQFRSIESLKKKRD